MKSPSLRLALSYSTLQQLLSQLSGAVVFLVSANALDKTALGWFNWVSALWLLLASVLGFGLEHLVVQKTAAGQSPQYLLALYRKHVLLAGLCILLTAAVLWLVHQPQQVPLYVLAGLAASQCLQLLATPYRQLANGLQQYRYWLWMSATAHGLRIIALPILFWWQKISLQNLVSVYVMSSLLEWLVSIGLGRMQLKIIPAQKLRLAHYSKLLKEAIPQLGVIICQTALSRLDWLLLGILTTPMVLAEYSVANKLFEVSTLPLLILAPVIFPRIAKIFSKKEKIAAGGDLSAIPFLLRAELVGSVCFAMLLFTGWETIVNFVTQHRYGTATKPLFSILCFAMPLLYANHLFWSILFAEEKGKLLFRIFLSALLVNVAVNLCLIPYAGVKAAAAAYLAAIALQTVLYACNISQRDTRQALFSIFPVAVSALASVMVSQQLVRHWIGQAFLETVLYIFLLWITGQWKFSDQRFLKKILLHG